MKNQHTIFLLLSKAVIRNCVITKIGLFRYYQSPKAPKNPATAIMQAKSIASAIATFGFILTQTRELTARLQQREQAF